MTTENTELTVTASKEEQAWKLTMLKAASIAKATDAVPKAFRGKPADICATFLMADELGISRLAALRGCYVVNGKVQLSGDLLLAVARGAGVKVAETWEPGAREDGGDAFAECIATLPNGEEVRQTYSVADAVQAGLWQSSDVWKKYPRRMLQMRARGWCLRDAVPDKLAGIYSEGELDTIDVTPMEVK